MVLCGGMVEARAPDADETTLLSGLKAKAEEKAGRTFGIFTPVSVRTQVVAGVNYFAKVDVGEGQFAHMRVHQPLPGQGEAEVQACQPGKTKDDPIEFVDKN